MSLDKISAFKDLMDKKYGKKNSPIEQNPYDIKIEKFSTGSLKLDEALKGGYPKGTVIELFGKSQSGKTTLCIHATSEHQKKYPNEPIMWIDLEKVFDPIYFQNLGVDINPEKFIIINKLQKGEDIWETIISFVKMNEDGLIVLDSVTGLLPSKEDEGEVGDAQMASAARMNSQAFRKLMPYIGFGKTTFIAVNQVRKNIGGYGEDEVTTGGGAWEFFSRTRIKTSGLKGEEGEYSKNKFKLVKANYGNKDKIVETSIEYGTGFNRTKELVDIAVSKDIIKKSGSWFSYDGTNLAQGLDSTVDVLNDNLELKDIIELKIKNNGI